MKRLILMVLLTIASALSHAQGKVPVLISSTVPNDDLLGRQYAAELREAIRGSPAYRLVEDLKQWPYLKIAIVTLSATFGSRNIGTAISYAITYDSLSIEMSGVLILSGVQICSPGEAPACAKAYLARVDEAVSALQREAPALRTTLN